MREREKEREKDSVFAFDRNESTAIKREGADETEVEVGAGRCMEASAHTFVWWAARQ